MVIGIDGNEANVEKKVGIGQYAFQLLRRLKKLQSEKLKAKSDKVEFVVYLKGKPREDMPKEADWWRYQVFGPKFAWTQFALPLNLLMSRKKPDVFFTPTHYAPRTSKIKSVISIMDMSFIHYPQMFNKKDLYQLKNWTAYSVKKAVKIFTISEFSKKEILDYYKIPAEKVIVSYPGYDRKMYRIKNYESRIMNNKILKDKYKIHGEYILFVGTLQPRKNIDGLLNAFRQVLEKGNYMQLKLVIAGKKGWLYQDIFKLVQKLQLEKNIIFTGFVKDEDLPHLYKSAKCLVLPSFYEGFGIPVLEALASGCPVVVSRVSSLPEVVGSAGIVVDPKDTNKIADGIIKVLNYSKQELKKIVLEGIKQAEKFSWEACAQKTLKELKDIVT